MHDCCQRTDIDQTFDRPYAERKLNEYRQKGLVRTTHMLVETLLSAGVQGETLLDIGGGVGAIQYALLKAGASRATSVDASRAYLDVARQEASRQGLSDHINYHYGNFVDLAPGLQPAGVVTLDRVICCYPDMLSLVRESAVRATKLYGLVFPRDAWWIRLGIGLENLVYRLQGEAYRMFAHPAAQVAGLLGSLGFERIYRGQTLIWQVLVYRRSNVG